jgi:hypothetical protein
MPRFVGRRSHGLWLDIAALVVLAIVIVIVLMLSGAIDVFGAVGPIFA